MPMEAATTNHSPPVAQNDDALLRRSIAVRRHRCDEVWSVARDLPAKTAEPLGTTRFPSSEALGNRTVPARQRGGSRDVEAKTKGSQFSVQNFRQLSRDSSNILFSQQWTNNTSWGGFRHALLGEDQAVTPIHLFHTKLPEHPPLQQSQGQDISECLCFRIVPFPQSITELKNRLWIKNRCSSLFIC